MSTTGLAASPGTDVEPMCWSSKTRQPRASRTRPARSSNQPDQRSSDSSTCTSQAGPAPGTYMVEPGGTGGSWKVTMSWREGILGE